MSFQNRQSLIIIINHQSIPHFPTFQSPGMGVFAFSSNKYDRSIFNIQLSLSNHCIDYQNKSINQNIYKENNIEMNKPFYGVAIMPTALRSQIVNNSKTPGPGTYDQYKEKARNQLPKWTLKKRIVHGSCFEDVSITPGPGGYEAQTAFKKLPQKKNVNKGQKYKSYIQKSYSSSALNLPGALNFKGGFSFGYREAFNQVQKSPGPIYHLDKPFQQKRMEKIIQSSRGFGFGQKNANYIEKSQTPGPGAFQTNSSGHWKSSTSEGWTFGTSPKSKQNGQKQLGPGQYNPKDKQLTRNFKFRGKNQPKIKVDNNTGPGSYDIPDTKLLLGTKFNVSKNKHKINQNYKSEDRLSPVTYDVKRYMDQPDERAGFSLGKRLNESLDKAKENPGPGSYQLSIEQVERNGGYIGRKIETKLKETAMDNFYKYNPNFNATVKDSFKYTFGQSKRYKEKENTNAQSYAPDFNIAKEKAGYAYSIGTAKRFNDLKKESGPFKEMMNNYSTIGNMPSYLKKSIKKK